MSPGLTLASVAALGLLASSACSAPQVLSHPESWNDDFVRLSPPTEQCPGGSLSQLRLRLAVSDPHPRPELVLRLPELLHVELDTEDELYSFQFSTDPDSADFWGFSGYLVGRSGCIVHVGALGYDN